MQKSEKIKPDIIFTSIFARLFLKKLDDGTYIGPWFMYEPMRRWSDSLPKMVYGERKMICQMPAEYDASIVDNGRTISMREMSTDLRNIPTELIRERAEFFLNFWQYLVLIEQSAHLQTGLTLAEFEHLQWALGSGPWEQDILIKELEIGYADKQD